MSLYSFVMKIVNAVFGKEEVVVQQEVVKPTIYLNEDAISFLAHGHPSEEQARIRAHIKAQEAKGIYEYSFSTSRWYFEVKNGSFKSSTDPEKLKINRI